MTTWLDPYRAVIREFNRRGVRYVVVGMSGINYYATTPRDTFATLDYDVFLEPTIVNVRKALESFARLHFTVGTSRGELQPHGINTLVLKRTTLVATTPDGLMIDALLQVSGYTFGQLAEDARTVTIKGVPIKIGQLQKLLRSKHLAARPKDRQFLKRYELLLRPVTPRRRRPSSR